MRKTTLKSTLRVFLLFLVTLVTGGGYALAEDGQIKFGTADGSVKISSASVTGNDNLGNAWTVTTEGTTSFTQNAGFSQVGSSKTPATSIIFTMSLDATKTITSFSAKFGGFSGTAGTISLQVDGNEVDSGKLDAKNDVSVESEPNVNGKKLTITVTGIAKGVKCYEIAYSYTSTGGLSAPALSLAAGTYWKQQPLSISVPEGATSVRYTLDDSDPKTSETAVAITEAASITLAETTTVRAIALDKDGNASNEVSRTYTFVPSIANTQETAYTVEEVKAIIDNTSAEQLADEKVFVKGKVSSVKEFLKDYNSITYLLDNDAFTVYSGKGLNGEGFSAKEDVEFGATVIVYGNVKKYNKTYEFDYNNYLVSYTAPAEVTLQSVAITGEASTTEYDEGATFSRSGLALTATYSDGSTQNVTADATWTITPETLTREVTEVTVTATYKEMTATKVVPVTVLYTEPVEGNSIVMATNEKDGVFRYAAMTTTLTDKLFGFAELYKMGDKYVTTGKLDDILFATGTTDEGTTIQNPGDGKYVAVTAVKKMAYTSSKYYWKNDGKTLTAATESYGVLKGNFDTPRFTTYNTSFGDAATIIDKSNVVEGATLTLTGKSDDDYYATFYSDKAVEFANATVYAVSEVDGKLKLTEVDGNQVPANTGVLVKSTTEQVVYAYIESAPAIENNQLRGSVTEESTTAPADGNYNYYMLSYDTDNANLGFYWGADNGAAFTNKAGHAYLAIPESTAQSVKGFSITDLETAISQVQGNGAARDGQVYDLQGRRVERAVRGLYIQNGRKVLLK